MPVRSSTPGWGNAPCGCGARQSAGFREETAIPKQFRAGMVLLTAFLIPPIRREGVMRTNLAIVAALLGCLGSAARADSASPPSLPNPQVNIQQPELARPMPRPQVRRPDPPVKAAAAKKVSRPERRHRSKRRPEKPKQLAQRPVEAKAKTALAETRAKSPPPHRPAPVKDQKAAKDLKAAKDQKVVKDQKAGTSDATSAVEPPAQAKPPHPEHRLRQPSPAILTTQGEPAVAAAPPPRARARGDAGAAANRDGIAPAAGR